MSTAVMSQMPVFGPVSMLPDRRPPWKEFGFGLVSQVLLVAFCLWVTLLHPSVLIPVDHDYHAITLVSTPLPVDQRPQPRTATPPEPLKVASEPLKLPEAVPLPKPVQQMPAPKIEMATRLNIPVKAAVPIPQPAIKINVFTSGSSQPATIAKPVEMVQTGGFGDPRGVPSQDNRNRPVTIAQRGAFDLPQGGGVGNGTAGQHGVRGVVASSGFGDGIAKGEVVRASNVVTGPSGFGDAQVVAPRRAETSNDAAGRIKPAEILAKPTPAYTEEARKLHIEGEVLVEVVFEGSGQIRIVRVVRGLGHGLDESAVQAAEHIRFTPAMQDGHPVDFQGVLHILFQLA